MEDFKLIISLLIICGITIGLSLYLEKVDFGGKSQVNYVPPTQFIKFISGTFTSFWADIFYIRGVMAITGEFKSRKKKSFWVQKNLNVATSLDSNLIQAYFFGGSVIGWNDETIKMCIQFLKKAQVRKPNEWRIPYWIGFNYYQLGEYLTAIKYYKKAAQFPDSPDFLKSNPPMLYYKGNKEALGVSYLKGLLKSTEDPQQLKWIKMKLRWLKNIVKLEKIVEKFKQDKGRFPNNLKELVKTEYVKGIPEDPFLGGYYWDKKLSQVRSKPKPPPKKERKEREKVCTACKK